MQLSLTQLHLCVALAACVAAWPIVDAFPRQAPSTSSPALDGPYGLDNADCTSLNPSIPVTSENVVFTNIDDSYSNQTCVSDLLLQNTGCPTEYAAQHVPGTTQPFTATFKIAAWYCQPRFGAREGSSLMVAVHGIPVDHRYWDFEYKPEYSFVKQAASYGYSTLVYDRLGTGLSETPSTGGFSVVQAPTEVAILREILTQLRQDRLPGIPKQRYTRTVLLGHSYGTVQCESITRSNPELVDAVVHTGFTTSGNYVANAFQAGAWTIANEIQDLVHLRSKPSIYITTGSRTSLLLVYFQPFAYDQEAFELTRSYEQPTTLGVLFTIGNVGGVAQNFTGPVLSIIGDRDFPFCSTNCSSTTPPIPEGLKELYPNARSFKSIILPNTGHAITPHRTGPQQSEEILQWVIAQGF